MREFYKRHRERGLVKFLQQCLDDKIRFSHNMLEIPTVECWDIHFEGEGQYIPSSNP
jgi:hypothetical protein